MTVLLKRSFGYFPRMFDILSAAYWALTQVKMRPPAMPRSSEIEIPDPAQCWTIIVGCYNPKLIQIFRFAASAANQQQTLVPGLQ